jgi:hypothetical protein
VTCLPDTLSLLDLTKITLDRVEKFRKEYMEEKLYRDEESESKGEILYHDEHVLIRRYERP